MRILEDTPLNKLLELLCPWKKVLKHDSFCLQLSDTCIAFQPCRSQMWLVWIFDQGKTDMGRLHSLLPLVLWLVQSHSHRNSSRAFIFLILFALTFAAKGCWGKKLWIPGLIFLSCCNEQERNAADFFFKEPHMPSSSFGYHFSELPPGKTDRLPGYKIIKLRKRMADGFIRERHFWSVSAFAFGGN